MVMAFHGLGRHGKVLINQGSQAASASGSTESRRVMGIGRYSRAGREASSLGEGEEAGMGAFATGQHVF